MYSTLFLPDEDDEELEAGRFEPEELIFFLGVLPSREADEPDLGL
jgi:hypothetical protein